MTKAKPKAKEAEVSSEAAEGTAAQGGEAVQPQPACGAVHPLPLLAHVTCQRMAGHPDDQPQAPDQGKHLARVAGALYVW